MPQKKPRADKRERIEPTWPHADGADHPVSEFAAVNQGALSPFGDDLTFPLAASHISYEHPEALPHLLPH